MKRLLKAAMCLLVAPSLMAVTPPTGGTALFSGDPTSVFWLQGPATKSVVAVNGMPFTQAIRVETLQEVTNTWEIKVQTSSTLPVSLGDVGWVHFYMRGITPLPGAGEVTARAFVELGMSPWTKSTNRTSYAGGGWVEVFTPFEFVDSYAAGDLSIAIAVGYGIQTLEIGGIEVLNYGSLYTVEELPRSPSTYPGSAPDAAWRASAAARIEQHRKADFTIRVLDANGQPVVLPQIEIRQARHAFEFGTASVPNEIMGTDADSETYRQKLLENFNALTTESALKMRPWQGDSPWFPQATTLAGLQWMQQNGFAVRGHVFVWPSYTHLTDSIRAEIDAGNTGAGSPIPGEVLDHIDDIAQATAAYVTEWDVVNEPYAHHELMDYFGDSVMVDWFNRARQNLPTVGLFLNDYGILAHGGLDLAHQDHFEQTAQYLIAQGAPITGLGMQSHFGDNVTPPTVLYDVLERFAALGLDIRITEFDVNSTDEQLQADYLRDFLTMVFSHPSVIGFQMWGFWEGRHWRPDAALYRLDWSEKPNLTAYQNLVLNEWWTDLQGWGDADGRFSGRAFKGTLTATATHGGDSKEITFSLGDAFSEVVMCLDTHVEPQPLRVSAGIAGTNSLSFGTVSGLDYQVEESDDLQTWSPLGPVYTGDGGIISFDVPATQSDHFYRLNISTGSN